jgi:hypothetical protein
LDATTPPKRAVMSFVRLESAEDLVAETSDAGLTGEQVVVSGRKLGEIAWTPEASAYFDERWECPQGGLRTRPLSDDADLAWYVA